jgi:hypothetical protein
MHTSESGHREKTDLHNAETKLADAKTKLADAKTDLANAKTYLDNAKTDLDNARTGDNAEAIEQAKQLFAIALETYKLFLKTYQLVAQVYDSKPRDTKETFLEQLNVLSKLSVNNSPNYRILASKNSQITVQAIKSGSMIGGVPLDFRNSAKIVFDTHFNQPTYNDRNPLLCNFGVRGSGKTVLLGFNMFWFLEKYPNGIAIEVSFNDDASFLNINIPPNGTLEFEQLVIRGILLRLVEFVAGNNFSELDDVTSNIQEQMEFIKHLCSTSVVANTIREALEVVRSQLGVCNDTPILLAVDEINKLIDDDYYFLSALCALEDAEIRRSKMPNNSRRFWLTASTNKLQKFATRSNRPLDLQPLPPIFPVSLDGIDSNSLPMILRIFESNYRLKLPFSPEALELYKDISKLLLNSGGHPRRVRALMGTLFELDKIYKSVEDVIKALHGWKFDDLRAIVGASVTRINRNMNSILRWEPSKACDSLVLDTQFLYDLVHLFSFPTSVAEAETHKSFLAAVQSGWGVFLPMDHLRGLLLVPYPCLVCMASFKNILKPLAVSIEQYVESVDRSGKAFEKCIYESLRFFTAVRQTFTLREWCQFAGSSSINEKQSVFDLELTGVLNSSDTWEFCPSIFEKSQLHTCTADDFKSKPPGVYWLAHKFNLTCDIVIIANVSPNSTTVVKRLVIFMQIKDWFLDYCQVDNNTLFMLGAWRWAQQFVLSPTVYKSKWNKNSTPYHNDVATIFENDLSIKPVFILFSANPIFLDDNENLPKFDHCPTTIDEYRTQTLRADEGLANLEHMKSWLPTVAYNVQVVHTLKSLWPIVNSN